MGKCLYENAGIRGWEYIDPDTHRKTLQITALPKEGGAPARRTISVYPHQLLALVCYFEANKQALEEPRRTTKAMDLCTRYHKLCQHADVDGGCTLPGHQCSIVESESEYPREL
jgi:hypothetical protein